MNTQTTLTDGTTADDRTTPDTFVYCDECDDGVLRSRRHEHEHDLNDAKAVTAAQRALLEDKVPDHAKVETKTYTVEFHYEYIEHVTVEASHRAEARTAAERQATYGGEYVDTIHTDTRCSGDASVATIDYLEEYGLLPDDHDVTQSDIEQLMSGDEQQ